MTDQNLELELNEAGRSRRPRLGRRLVGILDGLMDRLKVLFFDALLCFLLKKWRSVNSPVHALDLAKELLDTFIARQMGKVFFTNSGSEANDS
ncbi:hypothetical protein Syun_013014 [Stephania yunnanensis]|uniref:Uncharacterized protein n=1 Tax=Stephania yunnanensis TaxID=152371 RepID=A0AAP0K187_9MAGN